MIRNFLRRLVHSDQPLTFGVIVIAFISNSSDALAQSASSEAERLFDEARAALEVHDYAAACRKFDESNRLDPALGTLLNLARCEEERGRVATASSLFRQVREQLPPNDRRVSVADLHIAALAPRLPHLQFVLLPSAPPAMRVRIDDAELRDDALAKPAAIDPGHHRVTVLLPAQPAQTREVELEEGRLLEVRVPFPQEAPKPGATTRPTDQPPSPSSSGNPVKAAENDHGVSRRTVGLAVGGFGVASLLVGAVAGIAGLHQESVGNSNCSDATRTCNQKGVDANNAARTLATVSTVGFAVGIAGLGSGGYLYLTAAPTVPSGSTHTGSSKLTLGWRTAW